MALVYVPAGEFTMGTNEEGDEEPVHTVYLDGYYIDKYEVSNAQYQRCVEAGACEQSGCRNESAYSAPDWPVVCVDWNQAKAYCQWAGARLPTEAEWEKAARGTDARTYPWGNEAPDCSRANYCPGWPGKCCVGGTSRVGDYASGASPYGALDMAGNVWEWTADWYASDYYSRSPANNPQGPDSGQRRVLRGGSWSYQFADIRAVHRYHLDPSASGHPIGFRCVVSPGG
jgi:formylglycine-generating enzyme required for sulfatase activity